MREENTSRSEKERTRVVRLPRFILDDDIGLGDAIKRATSYIGIKPCGGCDRRAETLNQHVRFTNQSRRENP